MENNYEKKVLVKKSFTNAFSVSAILAFLLNLIIETLARQNILGGVQFLLDSPLVFIYNVIIIFSTLCIASIFKRRVFFMTIVSTLWLALGVVNGAILSNRMTPFTVYDLQSVKDGLSIASNYFKKWQIILIIIAIVLLVVGIVLLWKKAPKKTEVKLRRNIIAVIGAVTLTVGATGLAINSGTVDTYFPNLAYGYRDNGVPYCFINTWLNTGVSKPREYTEESIKMNFTEEELETAVGKTKGITGDARPNIIFIQLESLMDPTTLKDMEFSKDPIPNLRKLYKQCSSGILTVPSVGAGTANVEFESMTGMSVKFFGPGEYPYKNILLETTCESIPYNLKELGYSTHAIHNHRGVFYGRNSVFPNLGFDTFTSVEYMNNVSKTPKNWAKDNVLVKQMKDALESTKGKDYIYTISVQGHGKYPTEQVLDSPKIKVTKAPTEELKWQWEYYVNQIYEMDQFVAKFIEEMEEYEEDTVVVMYGDHVPALDNVVDGNLKDGRNTYNTDYFIWSNFDMDVKDQDLACYQIGSEVLKRLDICNGTLVTYHQNHQKDERYKTGLHDLQYDMLYGNRYIYNETNPWEKTDMKMGVNKISIDSIVKIGDKYYIKGQNFTEYSKVNLEGEILDTIYLGPTILALNEKVDEDDVEKMKVSQVEKKKEILSTTE